MCIERLLEECKFNSYVEFVGGDGRLFRVCLPEYIEPETWKDLSKVPVIDCSMSDDGKFHNNITFRDGKELVISHFLTPIELRKQAHCERFRKDNLDYFLSFHY